MKTKYLLRGIGIGLILGVALTFILLKATGTSTEKKTSDTKQVAKTTEAVTEAKTEAITEAPTTEAPTTEEVTTEAETEEVTTEEVTTEAPTTEEVTTEEATTEAPKDNKKSGKVTITVKSGMGSQDIAKMLEDQGIVKSASEFDAWLGSKGYDSKLRVGNFEFTQGMSDEDIAKVLMTNGQ